MRAKFSAQQTGKADKFIVLLQMEGKQRIAVLFAMRHDARQKSCAFIAALRGGEKFHHLGITIHGRKIVHMRFGKIYQKQSVGLQNRFKFAHRFNSR